MNGQSKIRISFTPAYCDVDLSENPITSYIEPFNLTIINDFQMTCAPF